MTGWTIFMSCCSAIFYRYGGMSSKEAGFKVNTKIRDLGVPAISLIWMFIYAPAFPWYIHFISFGLLFGSLTTYYDSLFGHDNFWFHGFMIGLAYLPYAISTGDWVSLIIRAVILSVVMGGLNYIVNKLMLPFRAWIEELTRGAVIILTLLLMF